MEGALFIEYTQSTLRVYLWVAESSLFISLWFECMNHLHKPIAKLISLFTY